ncbi:MAG: hypothetical protein ACE1Z8_03960 [Candidatus Acidiferrales bacterium]
MLREPELAFRLFDLAQFSIGLPQQAEARALLGTVHAFNRKELQAGEDWGFYEYGHARTGTPGGVRFCSWSAAGAVLLGRGLEGHGLFFG